MLDYLSRWIQAKQIDASRTRGPTAVEENIALVRSVLAMIPAELVSQRAIECRSYSRALFYWEQHIRQVRDKTKELKTVDMVQLQDIYTQIDEPDGIEGISAHLHVLDIDQQILAHRKAGRWTAAQSWYEIKLAETPDDMDVQVNLLTCLKESGQHGKFFGASQVLTLTDSWQMYYLTMLKVCIRPRRLFPNFSHSLRKLPGQQEDGRLSRNTPIWQTVALEKISISVLAALFSRCTKTTLLSSRLPSGPFENKLLVLYQWQPRPHSVPVMMTCSNFMSSQSLR